jgi:hypothetical protein
VRGDGGRFMTPPPSRPEARSRLLGRACCTPPLARMHDRERTCYEFAMRVENTEC